MIKGLILQFLFYCDVFKKYFELLIWARDVKMYPCERRAQLCVQMSSSSHNKFFFPECNAITYVFCVES